MLRRWSEDLEVFVAATDYIIRACALPDGRECIRSSPLLLSRKRFQPQNRLRLKTNFGCAFKSMTSVQIWREKYSALRSAKISRILLAIPPRAEGRFAIVTDVEAGSGGRGGSQQSFECGRTIASRTAKPCGPGAPTPALSSWSAQRAPWG